VNAILIGVAFIALAVICDRARRPDRTRIDLLNLALVGVTLLISGFALWAIIARLLTRGLDSTRLAVLGTDIVVFALFGGVLWNYVKFVTSRVALSAVLDWIARYLPVLPAWAATVVLLLPLDPVGWFAVQRSRAFGTVTAGCLYVTHESDLSVINTASNTVVATVGGIGGTPYGHGGAGRPHAVSAEPGQWSPAD
jgi:YVTN family beta-propeller protein